MEQTHTHRVVITGGPGTGKSTIIELLRNQGYPCFQEVSRSVIKEQLESSTDLLPWKDLSGFSNIVFEGQMAQYHRAEEGKINFYDRGLIDVIAYLRKDMLPSDSLEDLVEHYPYHHTVFVTPPWKEIYCQDEERVEDFETMQKIHHSLVDTYQYFEYKVIEIPCLDSQARVDFILKELDLT